jgi:hypothetical protein
VTISLILLLAAVPALTSSQGPYLEKDIDFRCKKIHQTVQQALQGQFIEPKDTKVQFNTDFFNVKVSMKF